MSWLVLRSAGARVFLSGMAFVGVEEKGLRRTRSFMLSLPRALERHSDWREGVRMQELRHAETSEGLHSRIHQELLRRLSEVRLPLGVPGMPVSTLCPLPSAPFACHFTQQQGFEGRLLWCIEEIWIWK